MRLALVLLISCGPRTLHVIPSPAAYAVTQQAAAAINAAAQRELISFDASVGPTTYVIAACGAHVGDTVLISSGSCNGTPEPVALVHELGHALGLAHSSDARSIMAPRFQRVSLEAAARSLVEELETQ